MQHYAYKLKEGDGSVNLIWLQDYTYRKIRILIVEAYIKLKIILFKGRSFSGVRRDILLEQTSELNIDKDLILFF